MKYICIEDRLYKLTEKQYKEFRKKVDSVSETVDGLNIDEWVKALSYAEDVGKKVDSCEHFCY